MNDENLNNTNGNKYNQYLAELFSGLWYEFKFNQVGFAFILSKFDDIKYQSGNNIDLMDGQLSVSFCPLNFRKRYQHRHKQRCGRNMSFDGFSQLFCRRIFELFSMLPLQLTSYQTLLITDKMLLLIIRLYFRILNIFF